MLGLKCLKCLKCGSPIDCQPGPGRRPTYCGEACKRLIEYEIRRVDRRLAAYELERRELKAKAEKWPEDDETRVRRLRVLRRWIAQDEAKLLELIGGGQKNQVQPA